MELKIDALRSWQRLKGWSDTRLAREAGVDGATLNKILNGTRRPGGKFIAGILRLTECPFDTFFRIGADRRKERVTAR